jgi:hypothetical protein
MAKHIDKYNKCKHSKVIFEFDNLNEAKSKDIFCRCICGEKWTKRQWLEYLENKE